ncbi:MAG TPA: hypothetical protein VHM70_07490 [Polyangiaceae bacterium]|nr:hypothetical protein [Polyangiaceae bacterium]
MRNFASKTADIAAVGNFELSAVRARNRLRVRDMQRFDMQRFDMQLAVSLLNAQLTALAGVHHRAHPTSRHACEPVRPSRAASDGQMIRRHDASRTMSYPDVSERASSESRQDNNSNDSR